MPYDVRKGGGDCPEGQWAVVNPDNGHTLGCHATKADATKQQAALYANVDESVTVTEAATLTEAAKPAAPSGGRRFRARLIEGDRWGASGYYSREVLERDGPTVWAEGTHSYLDHPTETEMYDRPERSVRDLAGKIASTPVYEAEGPVGAGLYADVEVYPQYAEVVEAMASDIGLSVRAQATVTEGEVDGRTGRIVETIVPSSSSSVDFVTKAGAGGRLVSLLESVRGTVSEAVSDTAWSSFSQSDYSDAQWKRACLVDTGEGDENSKARYKLPVREPGGAVNRNGVHAAAQRLGQLQVGSEQKTAAAKKLVGLYRNQLSEDPPDSMLKAAGMSTSESADIVWEAVASDVSRALCDAVDQAYPSTETSWAYMRDYDPDKGVVYFGRRDGRTAGVYQQPYVINDDSTASLTGDPVEVKATTVYTPVSSASESSVPVDPAGQSNRTSRESNMPQIEEARLRELEEAHGRVPTLESERDAERQRAEKAENDLAVEKAKSYARDYGTKRVREANSELPHRTVEKIVAEAMREIPLTGEDKAEDRRLDTEAFNARVDEAQKAEETYLAEISETTGRVRGLGQNSDRQVSESDVDNIIAGAFGRAVKGA
ncbi:MAG: hypothetical protein J2P24_00405 [Streptosporangiales bacterium]|nr:hypothetical protein [Streptosporangiales bacterium]